MKLSTRRMQKNSFLLQKTRPQNDLNELRKKRIFLLGTLSMLLCFVYLSSFDVLAADYYDKDIFFDCFADFFQQNDYLCEWDFERLDLGLSWTQLAEQSRSRWSSQAGRSPVIQMAGYMDTDISYYKGGELWMLAWVDDPDGDIETVEIYFEGLPTGVFLQDDGQSGDFGKGDGLYGIKIPIAEKRVNPLTCVLELKATDSMGNTSDLWPYLTIAN